MQVSYEDSDRTIQEPYEGMEFKSLEEAKTYYNQYARRTGFSTRKGSHYKSVKDFITSQEFTCSKEGIYKPKSKSYVDDQNTQQVKTPQKQAQSIRTGCMAHIRIRMVEEKRWIVSVFEKEHNHELIPSPSKARFFR